jgi:transposase
MQRVEDSEEIIERVAAIDVGKAEVVVCIRVPDPARLGRRQQEIVHSSTLTPRLLVLADRLVELGVTRVVMEATSGYVRREGARVKWEASWRAAEVAA